MITVEELRTLIRYEPETGLFTWLPRTGTRKKVGAWNGKNAGQVAGWVTTGGYIVLEFKGLGKFKAHRVAWLFCTGEWPKDEIDHINGKTSDNRIANLREANRSQNQANQKTTKAVSGIKGVHWDKVNKKWRAEIMINYRHINGGRYATKEEALVRYQELSRQYFGEFACDAFGKVKK